MDDGSPQTLSELDALSPDATFEALSDQHRRAVIQLLGTNDSEMTLQELADDMILSGMVTTDDPDQVQATLHHAALPKLDDLDILTYDPETRNVTPQPVMEELLPALDYLEYKRREELLATRLLRTGDVSSGTDGWPCLGRLRGQLVV